MPNTYPRNPASISLSRLKAPKASPGKLSVQQAKVCRKARTVLKLQDRAANQLFRLAAVSGALSKKALHTNNHALAGMAQTVASSARHLAKQMWHEYNTIATVALRLTGPGGKGAPVRSAAIGIAAKNPRTGANRARPKGPVNIVNPANLVSLMSKLKGLQRDLSRIAARRRR